MYRSIFRPKHIFNNDAYVIDFRANNPFDLFNLNVLEHQQALHFGIIMKYRQDPIGIASTVDLPKMYLLSKFEDYSLCGFFETELNATCEYFFNVEVSVKYRSWPGMHRCF